MQTHKTNIVFNRNHCAYLCHFLDGANVRVGSEQDVLQLRLLLVDALHRQLLLAAPSRVPRAPWQNLLNVRHVVIVAVTQYRLLLLRCLRLSSVRQRLVGVFPITVGLQGTKRLPQARNCFLCVVNKFAAYHAIIIFYKYNIYITQS